MDSMREDAGQGKEDILNQLSKVGKIFHHLVERRETAGESEELHWLQGGKWMFNNVSFYPRCYLKNKVNSHFGPSGLLQNCEDARSLFLKCLTPI